MAGQDASAASVQHFAYHKSLTPTLLMFLAIAGVELVVVHFLLMLWRPWVALLVSLVSGAIVIWIIGMIRSFRRLPVTWDGETLVMRAGRARAIRIPADRIAGLIKDFDEARLKQKQVANLARHGLTWPNIMIAIDPPVIERRRGRDQEIHAVAHKLDDVQSLRAAIGGSPAITTAPAISPSVT